MHSRASSLVSWRFVRRLVVCLLAATLGAGVASGPAAASGPASDPAVAQYEITFLEEMIGHHMMAAHEGLMAPLCVERAVHPELRQLCQDIIREQREEIHLMQGWLRSWYGIEASMDHTAGGHGMGPRDMAVMLEALPTLYGEPYEILFLQEMSIHHRSAVREARVCLRTAEHPELLALCRSIIASQRDEISQMQSWWCSWYGHCRRGAAREQDVR